MIFNQITNNSIINKDMLYNSRKLLSESGFEQLLSIFDNIDNNNEDEDKNKGIIKGNYAIAKFYAKVQAQFEFMWDKILSTMNNTDNTQSQDNNDKFCGSRSYQDYEFSVYQKQDNTYYAKFYDGQIVALNSSNSEEASSEASDVLRKKVEYLKESKNEVENNAPKSYEYKGIKVTVKKISFRINKESPQYTGETKYNYCAKLLGSFYDSTSKKEIEQWIDKKLEEAKKNGWEIY